MRSQIEALEKIARQLEPVTGKRDAVRKKVIDYTEQFINHIETIKAFEVSNEKGAGLYSFPIAEDPADIETVLSLLRKHVDHTGLNPASGGHLGYIPGGGIFYAALGDYLADVFNRYAGVYFASPGAVSMENLLIKWMAGLVGYGEDAAGNIASGGSIANLMGIVCARDASGIKARDFEKAVVYTTAQTHHSISKALRIAGLKECIIRQVSIDERYRMNPDELERMIITDKTNRLLPFLVVASAGTTDTGAIDPLESIGGIAKKHELWYNVDAAYGGFFMLTEEGKAKMKGTELSDTLVIDPHKSLFLPYGSGVLLAKERQPLNTSHYYFANYMQDTPSATEEISPADVSPELTKHFRGLRMWLPLKLLGLKPFRACLEEKLLLAKYFHTEIQKLGFEAGPDPELSVVTYRYVPKSGNADAFNKALLEAVQHDGRVFISSTLLNGKYTLRAAIVAFRTHLSTIDLLLHVLKEKVQLLEKQ